MDILIAFALLIPGCDLLVKEENLFNVVQFMSTNITFESGGERREKPTSFLLLWLK